MNALPLLNPEGVSEEEAATYKVREAARAIVTDGEGNIAVLHASLNHYYKLPGGGVETGESILEALHRECKEEIGCAIEVTGEVGSLTEYRERFKLKQVSYCYVARVVGDKCEPQFEQGEIDEGFEVVWVAPEEAYALIIGSEPKVYPGEHMIARDSALLRAAQSMLA